MSKLRRVCLPSKGSVEKHFQDYCANTSIHAVKYLGEKDRPKIERIWWIFVFGLAVGSFSYLIDKSWRQWNNSPVVVSLDELTPIWTIPFPAVTICREIKPNQRTLSCKQSIDLTNQGMEWNGSSPLLQSPYIHIMRDNDGNGSIVHIRVLTFGGCNTDKATTDEDTEAIPEYDETLQLCRWQMSVVNCNELFTPVFTEEGKCFTFNNLHAKHMYKDSVLQRETGDNQTMEKSEWTLENNYDITASLDTDPRRALGAGASTGISIVLSLYEYDTDNLARNQDKGFKIHLHNPAEVPKLNENYFRVPVQKDLVLSVKPNMVSTSESLRVYPPSSRHCYFSSERFLAYFKVYTQRNCELECLTNQTLKKCQCVAAYMPRFESTPLCGQESEHCVNNVNGELNELHTIDRMWMEETQNLENNTCDCLPACTVLQYDGETSMTHYFGESGVRELYKEGLYMSKVSIYFKNDQFIRSRMSELYSIADFFASCGGLLSLFSGVSFLSLVEIVYYITLRLHTNLKSQKESSDNEAAESHFHPDVLKTDPNEIETTIE